MLRPGLRPALRTLRPGAALPSRTLLRAFSVKKSNVPDIDPTLPDPTIGSPNVVIDSKRGKLGRLERYAPALAALSQRTGVSLPALTGAFLVLHEITAIVPVFLAYWVLHALGVGAGLVAWLADVEADVSVPSASADSRTAGSDVPVDHEPGTASGALGRAATLGGARDEEGLGQGEVSSTPGWKKVVHGWYEEGARKVERVGRRYGWLGYEKGSKPTDGVDRHAEEIVTRDAGAVADAVAAYVVVKITVSEGFRLAIADRLEQACPGDSNHDFSASTDAAGTRAVAEISKPYPKTHDSSLESLNYKSHETRVACL